MIDIKNKSESIKLLGKKQICSGETEAIAGWKKRQRKRLINIALCIIFLNSIVSVFLCLQPQAQRKASGLDFIFGIAALVLFWVLAAVYLLKWLKSFSWEPVYASYGRVAEKSRYSRYTASKGRNFRAYYVQADVNGGMVEGICEFEVYKVLDIGDRVLLFTIGTDEIFAVKL